MKTIEMGQCGFVCEEILPTKSGWFARLSGTPSEKPAYNVSHNGRPLASGDTPVTAICLRWNEELSKQDSGEDGSPQVVDYHLSIYLQCADGLHFLRSTSDPAFVGLADPKPPSGPNGRIVFPVPPISFGGIAWCPCCSGDACVTNSVNTPELARSEWLKYRTKMDELMNTKGEK